MSYIGHSLEALTGTINDQFVDADIYRAGLRIPRSGIIVIYGDDYYISKIGINYPFTCSYWSVDTDKFRALSGNPSQITMVDGVTAINV